MQRGHRPQRLGRPAATRCASTDSSPRLEEITRPLTETKSPRSTSAFHAASDSSPDLGQRQHHLQPVAGVGSATGPPAGWRSTACRCCGRRPPGRSPRPRRRSPPPVARCAPAGPDLAQRVRPRHRRPGTGSRPRPAAGRASPAAPGSARAGGIGVRRALRLSGPGQHRGQPSGPTIDAIRLGEPRRCGSLLAPSCPPSERPCPRTTRSRGHSQPYDRHRAAPRASSCSTCASRFGLLASSMITPRLTHRRLSRPRPAGSQNVYPPSTAGRHTVAVASPTICGRTGRRASRSTIDPGQTVEVHYSGPLITFVGGRMGFEQQPRPGMVAFWLILAMPS